METSIYIYGRRQGNTTRLINKAVEVLFEKEEIFIPDGEWINQLKKGQIRKQEKFVDITFIDHHINPNNLTQKDFKRRLLKRLELEHQYQFEVKGNWIILKK